MTLRRLSATPVRRSGGYLITAWYVPRCVMLRSRPYRRFVRERSIQPLLRPRAHTSGMRASNGYDVTKVECNTRSSIGRLPDHRMVCTEVCDAQEPTVSTICAREIDPTTSDHTSHNRDANVTVMTLRRLSATPVRRSCGSVRTARYIPKCVMLKSRLDRRFVRERSIQPLLRPQARLRVCHYIEYIFSIVTGAERRCEIFNMLSIFTRG